MKKESASPLQPQVEIIPEKAALRSEDGTTIHILLKITAPEIKRETERRPLNLGLVMDRSGSMDGPKLQAARAAGCFLVNELDAADRFSLTIYDEEVSTLSPSAPVTDRGHLERLIKGIRAGGSTALHAGWVEGGVQVSSHYDATRLNRVLLLSDGLANQGETNQDRICQDVHGLAKRGVSTSTMGMGDHYDEDLLEAMARSGDGNYYYIRHSADLPTIFETELAGLAALCGRGVRLYFQPGAGIQLVDVLNDLDRNSRGGLRLPNLVSGRTVEIVLCFQVPGGTRPADLAFTLKWTSPVDGTRYQAIHQVQLPRVSDRAWEKLPANEEVVHQIAHKQAIRMQQEAIRAMEARDFMHCRRTLRSKMAYLQAMAPSASFVTTEASADADLLADLDAGEVEAAIKQSKARSYQQRRGSSTD